MERLASWIGNIPDDKEQDQKLLLEYAQYITFFSKEDFSALYKTAFDREISRWVAEQVNIRLEEGWQKFREKLRHELYERTWYLPVSDSMAINEFYHVNRIHGISDHPELRFLYKSYKKAPESEKGTIVNTLVASLKKPNWKNDALELQRLVILEDFVGSGTQCKDVISWAAEQLDVPILFIPLIICPQGLDVLRQVASSGRNNLCVRPIIKLQPQDLLGPKQSQGWEIAARLETLVKFYHQRVKGSQNKNPFGYKNSGCSVVTFSNTPNNTLPIIHNKPLEGTWEPLFPRSSRE